MMGGGCNAGQVQSEMCNATFDQPRQLSGRGLILILDSTDLAHMKGHQGQRGAEPERQ